MANAAKISISIADATLLAWAKERAETTGVSLSSIFTEAVRMERQMEARRRLVESIGPKAKATPAEAAAIVAEWRDGTPDPKKRAPKRSSKKKRARR